jgi:hypothetical protein
MSSLMNAFQIHGNRVLSENQFAGSVGVPIMLSIFGFILFYMGLVLEVVPVIGSIFKFIGSLWIGISWLFFTYLGWMWFISFIYLLIISIWCLNITNKHDAGKEGKRNYETGEVYQIHLGKSYRVKQVISFIAASLITVTNEGMISYVVLLLDVHGNEPEVWTPWQGLI